MKQFLKNNVWGLVVVVGQFVLDIFRQHHNNKRRGDRNDGPDGYYEPYDY